VIAPLLQADGTPLFLAWSGLFFDLLVVPALLWRRTRWWALGCTLIFHAANSTLFDIGIFPVLMSLLTLCLLPSTWPRRLLHRVTAGRLGLDERAAPSVARVDRSGRRWPVLLLVVAWGGYNLVMPLRHWLYPGAVSWTEEGHLYAWHMKLRDKVGRVRFRLHDPVSGETWRADIRPMLTDRQLRKLQTRPDLAHQLAQVLARQAEADRGHPVEVHVDMRCRLNGHPAQRLIDPDVDLGAEPRSIWHKRWLLPFDGRGEAG